MLRNPGQYATWTDSIGLLTNTQFAHAVGAAVIALSSTDEKLAIAEELGAKHVINYNKKPNWSQHVLDITNGHGVDLVVDVVGAQLIKQTLAATRHGGHVVLVGNLSKDPNIAVDIMQDLLYGAKTSKIIHPRKRGQSIG